MPPERTLAQLIEIDALMLMTTGSARRDLMATERHKWHRELRRKAREHGFTLECGHIGTTAWAQRGYAIGTRHTVAPAHRDWL